MQPQFRVRHIVASFLFIALCCFLSDCEEEKAQPREYPRVKSLPVSKITEEGATFSADLYSIGTEIITEHGYVWGTDTDPDFNHDNKILLGIPAGEGVYSTEIKSTLYEGKEYTVRPYVKTEEHIVYGSAVTFVSLGSLAPVITGFEPDSAGWGDTLRISGHNFSWVGNQNIVKLNEIICDVIISTDTTISVRIDPYINTFESLLTITLAGNTNSFSQKTFKLIPPVLKDFYPRQAWWGDTLHLTGSKFRYLMNPGSFIKLGDYNCKTIGTITDSTVTITIPNELDSVISIFVLKLNNFILKGKQEFELLAPYFTFADEEHTWGETVTLTGAFNKLPEKNKILFNGIEASIISTSIDSLQVKVPNSLSVLKSFITYNIIPFSVTSTDTFRLLPPSINSFSPMKGTWGSTITLTGIFHPVPSMNSIYFNDINATIASSTLKTISVKVPNSLADIKTTIINKINAIIVTSCDSFKLAMPVIESFYPQEGTWQDQVTLTGIFHPEASMNIVTFNETVAPVISATSSTMNVSVPSTLADLRSGITNKINSLSSVSADTFNLFQPVIKSFSPISGFAGSQVTIKGKYLGKSNVLGVIFGDVGASFSNYAGDTMLTATVPSGVNGPVKISVIQAITVISTDDFTAISPIINSISPLTATFNEEVTIEGENFSSGNVNVKFGTVPATVKTIEENKIVVYVPASIDSIPRKIIVTWGSVTAASNQNFVLKPPEINNISPATLTAGQDITITGNNFHPSPSGNKVSLGSYDLTVRSSTATQIIASLPAGITRGSYKISVVTGGYRRYYPDIYEIESQWLKIQLPVTFEWNSGEYQNTNGISFSINNLGYMMDYFEPSMTSFDPLTNEFVDLGAYPPQTFSECAYTVVKGTVYAINGSGGVKRYNAAGNAWEASGNSIFTDVYNGVAFSLNDSLYYGIYVGPESNSSIHSLWIWQSESVWLPRASLPDYTSSYSVSYFVMGNKGYILFADKTFCEYNPETDAWKLLTTFPGQGSGRAGVVSFVINGKGYVGLGRDENNLNSAYDDFWIYDPASDTWTEITHMPLGGRYNSISFVVNNKAYIGFGNNSSTIPLKDFYEFDPGYPLK
ncbi:MAG: IPT/TIG domain-containing protein [Bacteroidota bacterium]